MTSPLSALRNIEECYKPEPVGRRIYDARASLLKISQGDLAEAAGLSQAYVSLVESGQKFPSPEAIRAIWLAIGRLWSEQEAARRDVLVRLEGSGFVVSEKYAGAATE
jgi:transcriptional regulator with XRE-family HTH domain